MCVCMYIQDRNGWEGRGRGRGKGLSGITGGGRGEGGEEGKLVSE